MKCLLVTVSALWILLPQSYELIRLEVLKVLPKFTKPGRTKPGLESNVTQSVHFSKDPPGLAPKCSTSFPLPVSEVQTRPPGSQTGRAASHQQKQKF